MKFNQPIFLTDIAAGAQIGTGYGFWGSVERTECGPEDPAHDD